jgi:hypothetical protein
MVQSASERDMDRFVKECAYLFHDKQLEGHWSLSFCIQFFRQHVSIDVWCALVSTIKRKIVLVGDACSRPPIIVRSYDLHAGDIKGAVNEITSYFEV